MTWQESLGYAWAALATLGYAAAATLPWWVKGDDRSSTPITTHNRRRNMYYTVEIPHQFPAEVYEYTTEAAALDFYGNAAWMKDQYTPWCEDNNLEEGSADSYWEWAESDLHALYRFESLEELVDWARRYASDHSSVGQGGGHQSRRILAQVEALLEEQEA